MSANNIRKLMATLAFVLVLVSLGTAALSEYQEPQPILPPYVYPKMFPGKSALELMQISQFFFQGYQLRKRIKAGEVIQYGNLKVTSQPEGAGVLVSSYVPLGETPFEKDKLPTGPYRVTVRKDGHYEQVRMVDISADETREMHFELRPIPYAHLTVESFLPGVKTSVIGVAEEYAPGMKLVPGDYLVSVRLPIYGKHRLYAELGDNQNLTLKADFIGRPGSIKVTAYQPDATVYIDGQEAGRTPLTISKLLPGPHKLQVWKSLFKPTTKIVHVESGHDSEVAVDLVQAEHFINSLGMEFVKIPSGSFMMGFRDSAELMAKKMGRDSTFVISPMFPRHLVEITKPFFMQTTEVTQGQYAKVTGDEHYLRWYKDDEPVALTTMQQVEGIIAGMNQRDAGKWRYRLPTEAQWEYAARAGTTSPFYTGETISTDQANYNGAEPPFGDGIQGIKRPRFIKTKSFSPNPWGLYDMHGNVSEICADWSDVLFYARSPLKDPKRIGNPKGQFVQRGGNWSDGPDTCLSANRSAITNKPYGLLKRSGFRLVAEKMD